MARRKEVQRGGWCAWWMCGQHSGQSPSSQAGLRDLGHQGLGAREGQVRGLGAGIKGCEMRLWGGKAELKRCT